MLVGQLSDSLSGLPYADFYNHPAGQAASRPGGQATSAHPVLPTEGLYAKR